VFVFVSLLTTGVARVAGGGPIYHGAGLGVARGDDAYVNGLVDDARLVDARLVFWWPGMSSNTKSQPFLLPLVDTRDIRLGQFEINHYFPLALFVIPHGHPLYLVVRLKRAVESVASLIISSAQSAAARYCVPK
jgi:hypothetical protein